MAIFDKFRKPAPGETEGTPAPVIVQGAKIGREALIKANETLREYKEGKANLEKRITESEKWFRMRHWELMEAKGQSGNPYDNRPASAWLFNVLMGKQADAIEAYPEPRILPRMVDDKETASMLSDIVPLIMDQCGFEQTYSDNSWKKNKTGTAVYGCFWDKSKHNGLGDVAIRRVDVLNLFWQPGIHDIQDSRDLFHAELMDTEVLREQYPQLSSKIKDGKGTLTLAEYENDDHIRTDKKSMVIDWYYKRLVNGKTVLHYCKYVGDVVLFSTENDPQMAEKGWYDDGLYPFVVDVLFPVENSVCGIGYVDICKSPQESIDLLGQQLVKNATMAATPRYFSRDGSGINETEFMDWTKSLVHVGASIDPNMLTPIQVTALSSAYLAVYQQKIDELKNVSANTDVMNGGTGGMTTASGIAAMQESAGRSSRASTMGSYRAYSRLVTMVIERARQFYDVPRSFRILGEKGAMQFVQFSNKAIVAQNQGNDFGIEMGYRLPVFDVVVKAAKQTPFSRQAQNDLATQLYGSGVFNPQMSDQALMMLDMMDFPGKDELELKVQQNGTIFQQLQMALQMLAGITQKYEPESLPQMMAMFGMEQPQQAPPPKSGGNKQINPAKGEEAGIVRNARERAANVNQPR